jgi:hypothetical protein
MQGKLWIDKPTCQWVNVEAEVVHPVSIAGFLAQVQPGTRFELEKMPVVEGSWLPKHFSTKMWAKSFFSSATSHKPTKPILATTRRLTAGPPLNQIPK